jgi:hypothetical protein
MLIWRSIVSGADGSRFVSVLVDPTGTGKNFVAAKVTKNGDPAPKANGSDQVKLKLPAGTKCTGGKAGNLCLPVSICFFSPLLSLPPSTITRHCADNP